MDDNEPEPTYMDFDDQEANPEEQQRRQLEEQRKTAQSAPEGVGHFPDSPGVEGTSSGNAEGSGEGQGKTGGTPSGN